MKILKKSSFYILPLLLLVLGSCAGVFKLARHERIAGIQPSVRPIEARPYRVLGKAHGKASTFSLFFVANVTPEPAFNRAIEEMIQEKGGDDLIEVYFTTHSDFWMVGTVEQLHIYGKVIKYEDTDFSTQ